MREVFSKCGEISKLDIVREPFTKVSRGFGFVSYENPESARKALDELDGVELDGNCLIVRIAKRKHPRPSTPGKYLGKTKRSYRGGGRRDERRRYEDRRYSRRDRYRDERERDRDREYGYRREERYERERYDDRNGRLRERDRYEDRGERYPRRFEERYYRNFRREGQFRDRDRRDRYPYDRKWDKDDKRLYKDNEIGTSNQYYEKRENDTFTDE